MKKFGILWAAWLLVAPVVARAEGGGDIKGMRIEPASVPILVVGKARLTVESLERGEGGLHAPYRVDVQGLPTGGEDGKFTITLTDADFDKLADGKAFNFSGRAVSTDGNESHVRGTATPSSGDGGAVKIKVESKRGMLVFLTTYRLVR